ncbi:hypothetical protein KAT82_01665 [bacterium]|nr:hypothetical protein [bacterium]
MSTRTAISVAMLAVLVLVLGLAGTAGARSMELGEGAMFGDADPSRDIQETIWFQGFVADPGTGEPVNATYTVTARMYDSELGGTSVWGPETHLATVIVDGWFNIELGAVIGGLPAFDAPPYYLQLWIDGEMLEPRLKLASVPSAFQSLGADNGLNLPYYGSHGTSGHAFHIDNTGPNVCGYFVTNNAGSTAASLYGAHTGTGPAVLGWHTGSGAAIMGLANGSGYAGVFEGTVTVTDSILAQGIIKGRSLVSEHSISAAGTLTCGGIWMTRNPVEGYVLRCADVWGNAEWGPPNIIDTHNDNATVVIGSSATQYDDAQVTLTVPGPGYIVVTSSVRVKISHTYGTMDNLELCNSTSSSSFGSDYWFSMVDEEIPSSYPTDTDIDRHFSVHSTHEVTASGSYTYYLVGRMVSGQDSSDRFWFTQMTGIYYPYPIPVREDAGEDAELLRAKLELDSQ